MIRLTERFIACSTAKCFCQTVSICLFVLSEVVLATALQAYRAMLQGACIKGAKHEEELSRAGNKSRPACYK